MKILFLDIDGVLNSRHFFLKQKNNLSISENAIDPIAVDILNKIVMLTSCDIVISSTWRLPYLWDNKIEDLFALLKNVGIKANFVGITPDSNYTCRGDEIQAWLDKNQNIDSFVIIDDNNDMNHLQHFLVQTSFNDGLQNEHINKIVDILNKEN